MDFLSIACMTTTIAKKMSFFFKAKTTWLHLAYNTFFICKNLYDVEALMSTAFNCSIILSVIKDMRTFFKNHVFSIMYTKLLFNPEVVDC